MTDRPTTGAEIARWVNDRLGWASTAWLSNLTLMWGYGSGRRFRRSVGLGADGHSIRVSSSGHVRFQQRYERVKTYGPRRLLPLLAQHVAAKALSGFAPPLDPRSAQTRTAVPLQPTPTRQVEHDPAACYECGEPVEGRCEIKVCGRAACAKHVTAEDRPIFETRERPGWENAPPWIRMQAAQYSVSAGYSRHYKCTRCVALEQRRLQELRAYGDRLAAISDPIERAVSTASFLSVGGQAVQPTPGASPSPDVDDVAIGRWFAEKASSTGLAMDAVVAVGRYQGAPRQPIPPGQVEVWRIEIQTSRWAQLSRDDGAIAIDREGRVVLYGGPHISASITPQHLASIADRLHLGPPESARTVDYR